MFSYVNFMFSLKHNEIYSLIQAFTASCQMFIPSGLGNVQSVYCCCFFVQFLDWKNLLEKDTNAQCVQHGAACTLKSTNSVYFYCHRSGQVCKGLQQESTRQRAVKSQGETFLQ